MPSGMIKQVMKTNASLDSSGSKSKSKRIAFVHFKAKLRLGPPDPEVALGADCARVAVSTGRLHELGHIRIGVRHMHLEHSQNKTSLKLGTHLQRSQKNNNKSLTISYSKYFVIMADSSACRIQR